MAGWVRHWLNGVSDAHLQRILQTEYGGMNEVLYNLAAATKKEEYLELGHRFAQPSFFDPLAEHRDELKGLHENTHVPKVIGAARRYELTGERRYRDIAEYFWHQVAEERSYCIGNSSNGELWRSAPHVLAKELSPTTAECCCAYNMLKLTRHLFSWTGDARYADYYERALFNCRLGTQHPDDGRLMYYFPLASGYWKLYGSALDAFWCCTGTGVEEYAKLADSIYFHTDSQPHRQPVRRVGAALDREGRARAAGHALPAGRSHPLDRGREGTVRVHASAARAVLGGWRQRLDEWRAHPRLLITIELSLADADVEEWRCRRVDAADAAAPLAHARRPQRAGRHVRTAGAGGPSGERGAHRGDADSATTIRTTRAPWRRSIRFTRRSKAIRHGWNR